MRGHEKIIEYLNSALKHELTASSQFWLHYRLLDDWGLKKLAGKWRAESIEEMEHADALIVRIIYLEGHPNLQKLNPLMIGETAREVLDADLRIEYEARGLYKEARDICEELGDYVTKNLFEKLMTDEEGHIDFLETQIDLLNAIGDERYAQLNAASADQSK
jgi:bacterioferritin